MAEHAYQIRCVWDDEARVWVATSEGIPGLATGADTLDELIEKLRIVIPELLEANGILGAEVDDIPFSVHAERHERTSRAG